MLEYNFNVKLDELQYQLQKSERNANFIVTFISIWLDWSSVTEYYSSFICLNLQTFIGDMHYFETALFTMCLLL